MVVHTRERKTMKKYTQKGSIPEEIRNSVESDTHARKGMLNDVSVVGLLALVPKESTPSRLS